MISMATFALLLLAAGLAAADPELIRGVTSPVYHLYLQAYPEDPTVVALGPESSAETFEINGTIQSTNTSMYVNIGNEATSYKSLNFGETAEMTAWGLEGDTIITTRGSSYGRQLNFLVCRLDGEYWDIFLQTGSDMPSGRECSNYQTIHLPCLC